MSRTQKPTRPKAPRAPKPVIERPAPREQDMSEIGQRGGQSTLKKKGRNFFRKIAGMRKTFGGGRPRLPESQRKRKSKTRTDAAEV